MGDRLTTIDMGRKVGAAVFLLGGPHLTQCRLGRGYFRTKWYLDLSSRLTTVLDMGRKVGVLRHFGKGNWVPI